MPLQSAELHRRLSFIKYLSKLALAQSHKSQKLAAAVSILLFHDAVESFLQLAMEHHGVDLVKNPRPNFLDYWPLLESAGCRLDPPGPLKRFNEVRVGLKHRGIDPSWEQIESTRANVTSFFEVSTPVAFPPTTFQSISLSAIVLYDEPRGHLETAEQRMQEGKYDDALGALAFAFEKLLTEYENRATEQLGRSPFFVGPTPRGAGPFIYSPDPSDRGLHELSEAIQTIQAQMKVLILGLDYRQYSRFIHLVPRVMWMSAGTPQLLRSELARDNPTLEECEICFDFVIDCALRLQEVEYGARPEAT